MITGFAFNTVMPAFAAAHLIASAAVRKERHGYFMQSEKYLDINSHAHPCPHEYTDADLHLLLPRRDRQCP